jgi:hypothetical protein
MRAVVLAQSLLLVGCSDIDWAFHKVTDTVESAFVVPSHATPARARPRPAPAQPSSPNYDSVSTAKPPAAPDTRPVTVNGLSDKAVSALLGQPASRTGPAPGETWTYRSGSCEVALYLFPDVNHGGLHVLDYRVNGGGAEENTRQACLRRLRDDRSG